MLSFHFVYVAAALGLASAAPHLHKRIQQVIDQSTVDWVNACTAAGGGLQCNPISVTAFTTLLAAAGNCDQQDSADAMVDLAKQLGNNKPMIQAAQIFVQQPRNSPNSVAVPYCQKAPKNAELNGLFHCQFVGVNEAVFSGDQTGNLPLGVKAVSPPGSCPASKTPIANGVQLSSITKNPGTPIGGGSGSSSSSSTTSSSSSSSKAVANPGGAVNDTTVNNGTTAADTSSKSSTSSSTNTSSTTPPATAGCDSACQASNVAQATTENASFKTAKQGDACTQDGCIGTSFAICENGKFDAPQQCAAGTQCFSLPLVNKKGTSIACDTTADAALRMGQTPAA